MRPQPRSGDPATEPGVPEPAILRNPLFHENSNHNSGDQNIGVTYANRQARGNCTFSNSHYQRLENNRHDGPGGQYNGVNNHQRGFQLLQHVNQSSSSLALVCIVAIVVIIALSLGLGLGLNSRQDHNESNETSPATLPPTTSKMATLPTTTTVAMTSTTTSNTSTTPAPTESRCKYGCYQDFVEISGCHDKCPGAFCLDDTGCEDPYPCISSTCCHTGCLPDWSCNGWCAGLLTCVSAPSTVTTATSTCSGTRG